MIGIARILMMLLVGVTLVGATPTAQAEEATAPAERMVVIGDSLAEGLHFGLHEIERDAGTGIEVVKKTRINTGLVRKDKFDWLAEASEIAAAGQYSTAILSFGANDLVSFRDRKPPLHFGDEEWRGAYLERCREIAAVLEAAGLRTVWVGIPIVRADKHQKEYAFLNGIFAEAAKLAGAEFVDTWQAFAVDGAYSDKGADLAGETILLRHTDGVHFTPQGYIVYASKVRAAMAIDSAL